MAVVDLFIEIVDLLTNVVYFHIRGIPQLFTKIKLKMYSKCRLSRRMNLLLVDFYKILYEGYCF